MQSDAFHREKIASLGFCRQASFLAVLDVHQVLTIFNVRSIDGKLIACSQLQQVTSWVWHHEELAVLVVQEGERLTRLRPSVEGDRAWREEKITKEKLCELFAVARVSGEGLRCAAYQRDICVLLNIWPHIIGLQWSTRLGLEVAWVVDPGERPVLAFCDRLVVSFDTISSTASSRSLVDGSVKSMVKLDFDTSSTVVKIACCPKGLTFAALTKADRLFIGKGTLHPVEVAKVCDLHISTGTLSVLTEDPYEYHVFSTESLHLLHRHPVPEGHMAILLNKYDRPDRFFSLHNGSVTEAVPATDQSTVSVGDSDVRTSLLSNALKSQHLESAVNVLKIAEHCDEKETCAVLQVLDKFGRQSQSGTLGWQVLALAIGFAGRALKRFPHCATILNLLYEWRERIPYDFPAADDDSIWPDVTCSAPMRSHWCDMTDEQVIEEAAASNQLALAQCFVLERGSGGRGSEQFRKLDAVRRVGMRLVEHQLVAGASDADVEFILRNLALNPAETWMRMLGEARGSAWRYRLAGVVERRGLMTADVAAALRYIELVDGVIGVGGGVGGGGWNRKDQQEAPTLAEVRSWSADQRRLRLAELFVATQSDQLLEAIEPVDVWQVLLDKRMLPALRRWIGNQRCIGGEQQAVNKETDGASGEDGGSRRKLRNDSGCIQEAREACCSQLPYSWPINEAMLDRVLRMDWCEERSSLLIQLASGGLFTRGERTDLPALLKRFRSVDPHLNNVERIVASAACNMDYAELRTTVFDFCAAQFRPQLFYALLKLTMADDAPAAAAAAAAFKDGDYEDKPLWMRCMSALHDWLLHPHSGALLARASYANVEFLAQGGMVTQDFWKRHPFVALFLDSLAEEPLLDCETVRKAVATLPHLSGVLLPVDAAPTVYELLHGEIPVHVNRFFRFRNDSGGGGGGGGSLEAWQERLARKHASSHRIDWTFDLLSGRPVQALQQIRSVAEGFRNVSFVPFAIHALAMDHPWDLCRSQSCILLMEMLGYDPHPLRITLAVLDHIRNSGAMEAPQLTVVCRAILSADEKSAHELLSLLRESLCSAPQCGGVDAEEDAIDRWQLAVDWANLYGLPLPLDYGIRCAQTDDWLRFLVYVQRYDYPPELVRMMLQHFTTVAVRKHLHLALGFGQEDGDVIQRVYECCAEASPAEQLLAAAVRIRSVHLAALAADFDPQRMTQRALCVYISLRMEPQEEILSSGGSDESGQDSDVALLNRLLESALRCKKLPLIVQAFRIFLPDSGFGRLFCWIDSFIRTASGGDPALLEETVQICGSDVSYEMLTLTLQYVLADDPERQLELVRILIDSPSLSASADWMMIRSLLSLSIAHGIDMRMSQLLAGRYSQELRTECQRCVRILLQDRQFEPALRLAHLAELPADGVFVSQLSFEAERNLPRDDLNARMAFWSRCHQLLQQHRVDPQLASDFFRDSLELAESDWERNCIVGYAIRWSVHVLPVPEQLLMELQVLYWKLRIEAELSAEQRPPDDSIGDPMSAFITSSSCPMLMEELARFSSVPDSVVVSGLRPEFLERIAVLISDNLDAGNLVLAARLSSMFAYKHADLDLILIVMQLVQDSCTPQQARLRIVEIGSGGGGGGGGAEVLFSGESPAALLKQQLIDYVDGSVGSGRMIVQRLSACSSAAALLDMTYDYLAQHPRPLSVLKMLLSRCSGGARLVAAAAAAGSGWNIARQWVSAWRIDSADVVQLVKEQLVEAVCSAYNEQEAGADNEDDYVFVSGDPVLPEAIPTSAAVAAVVVGEAAMAPLGATESSNMVVSLLHGQFHRLATLCPDTTQLGLILMDESGRYQSRSHWSLAVELLVFAHSSFTLACDVENIGRVLKQARMLVEQLGLGGQWHWMTRILTGIQRYQEMAYVFQLLKDKGQFEALLRKGMDRLPLLRLALLDFLAKSDCDENRDLYRLVALHFHMHTEVAAMWQQEADSAVAAVANSVRKQEAAAPPTPTPFTAAAAAAAATTAAAKVIPRTPSKKLGSSPALLLATPPPQAAYAGARNQDVNREESKLSPWKLAADQAFFPAAVHVATIKCSNDLKQRLTSAMHNAVHAAEYYLQAGKLNHADKCRLQAELVALQIHLLERAANNAEAYCILQLSAHQVHHLIVDYFTYPEAEIVSRAYGVTVNWGRVLVKRYVVRNAAHYLDQFCRRNAVSGQLIEEALVAFEMEPRDGGGGGRESAERIDRLSQLVAMLCDLETKYRIASRFGLRKLVSEQLLSAHALPYLKDTAWKTAKQH